LRGFFCKCLEGGFGRVKCTYLIDNAAEFAVVASNYGGHILKFSVAKKDTPLPTSVS